jgi:PKD repeat protein
VDQPSVAAGAGSVWITYADTFNGTVVAAGATVTGLDAVGTLASFTVPGAHGGFGDIGIGPAGEVLVLWEEGLNAAAAPPLSVFTSADPDGLGPASFSEPRLLARTFTPVAPFPFMPTLGIDSEFNLAWHREGGEHGRVYVAYTEPTPPEGHPEDLTDLDIYLRYSDDAGTTWQSPVKVSDAPAGTFQFLPGIAVDRSTGQVAVGWYDTRRDPAGVQAEYMVAVSQDRGASFSPSQRVSLGASNATLLNTGVVGRPKGYGDYSTLAFDGGVLHPVWADNSPALPGIPDRPQFDVASAAIGVIQVDAGRLTILPRAIQVFEEAAFTGTVATFSHPEATRRSQDFTALIDWGDGTTATEGVVTGPNSPTFSITGTHSFADTGIFPVSVTVRDLVTGRDAVAVSNVSHHPAGQAEGTIAIDPTDTRRAFAASVHLALDASSGILVAVSENGGATWVSRIIADGSDGFPAANGDPRAAFDQFGNLFLTYITTDSVGEDVVVLLSEDGGQTFSTLRSFSGSGKVDQPTIVTGPGRGGTGGSVWLTFERAGGENAQVIHAAGAPVTGKGAVETFDLFRVSETTDGSRNFGDVAVGPQGQVLVSYQVFPASGSSSMVVHLDPDGLGPSAFGTATFITNTAVGAKHTLPAQNVRTVDAEGNLAWDRSNGDFRGRVYFAYTDVALLGDSTDTDIFLRVSEDNGATWGDRVQINDDASGSSQFLPSLAVDQTTGALAIGWHSTQGDPANVKTSFFATTSGDGGASFARRVPLSAGPSDATDPGLDARGKEFQFGDYTGLAFHAGVLEAVWGDNSAELPDNPKRPQLDLASGRLGVARVVGAPLDVTVQQPDGVVEGKEFTDRVARFTDPQPESGVSADHYSATISWGDGTDPSAGTIVPDGVGGYLVRGTHQYRRFGSYTLSVTVAGRGATPATETDPLEVEDAPITPSPVFVRLVDDVLFADTLPGPPFDDVVATFTDANPFGLESDFSAKIDWDTANAPDEDRDDDQSGLIASVIGPSGHRVFLVRGNNIYHNEGGYQVEVEITSKGAKPTDDPVTVTSIFTVGDPALQALAPLAFTALEDVDTGTILLGSFLTGGPVDFGEDAWEAEVDWGDGTLPEQLDEANVLIEPFAPFPDLPNHVRARLHVIGGHTYADGGVHTGTLTITSDNGDSQSFAFTATVATDVTARVRIGRTGLAYNPETLYDGWVFINNPGSEDLTGPFTIVFDDVPTGVTFVSVPDLTAGGDPFLTIDQSRLLSGASTPLLRVKISDPTAEPIAYSMRVFAGALPDSPATAGLVFEPNLGQATDSVSFVAVGTSYAIGLAADHAALALSGEEASAGAGALIEWVGANDAPVLRALELLPGTSNYLTAGGSITGVPHYGRVRYESIYDGIDLEYYGRQGQLEYDWIVRPGADVSDIAVRFRGVDAITPDAEGNLRLLIDDGELIQRAPIGYQIINGERRRVATSFQMRPDGTIGVAVGTYDRNTTLVIDPVLVYSTYLGGSGIGFLGGADSAQAVAVDAHGNAYVTGSTVSPDFPTAGAFDGDLNEPETTLFQVTRDAFITKFDPDGSVVFSTYFGGGTNDTLNPYGTVGRAIAVDGEGHVFVGGGTNSHVFPVLNPAPVPRAGLPTDRFGAFLSQLSPDGSALLYSTYLEGYGDITDLAIDGEGAVYAALGAAVGDNQVPIALKVDTSQNQAPWFRVFPFFGGLSSIAVDGLGQAYVVGTTTGTDFKPKNALIPTLPTDPLFPADTRHAFVAKLAAGGQTLFATLLGGSGRDFGGDIALDGTGSIWVTGTTESPDFPVPGGLDTSRGGSPDGFLARLASDGSELLYGTYLGGSGADFITGLGLAADGTIYVAGTTESPDLPAIHARQPTMAEQDVAGLSDGFVAAIAADGASLEYLTYVGGTGDDLVEDLAVDAAGTATVVGRTGSLNFPLHDAFQNRPIFDDAFVVRLAPGTAGALELRNSVVQVVEGTEFEALVASFTTNGVETPDQFSAMIDWGDGTASAGTVEGDFLTGFQIFGRHRYLDVGGHDIRVTLGDSLGRPVTATGTESGGGLDHARYHVAIDTSTLAGSAGQLAFQFNPGAIPGGPEAQARVSGLRIAGGTLGAATAEGGASVDAQGGILLRPDTVLNRLLQTVTLGASIEFDLELSGAGIAAPQNGTVWDVFALQLFAPDGTTPLLGADATGSLMRVDLRPDGSTRAHLAGPEVRAAALGHAIILNAPLDVDLVSFTVQEGLEFVGAVATFTSANPLETADGFSAAIDWADGSPPSPGEVTFDGARFTVTGTHTYLRAGLYPFSVVITEPDGASTAAAASSVVSPVQASYRPFPASGGPSTVGGHFQVGADFNGDGTRDAVSSRLGSPTGLLVWLGDGDFGFAPPIAVTTTNGVSNSGLNVAAGDFNGDGVTDLAISGGRVEILLGNGDGTFVAGPAGPLAAGPPPASLAAGDFDGDGRTDLVLGYFSATQVSTFRGNGDGTFQAAVGHPVSVGSNWPLVSDLNGDGRSDIVVAVSGARAVGVFLGEANGEFTSLGPIDVDTAVASLAVKDATGDGIPDIVAGGTDIVVRAGGGGAFGAPVHHATPVLAQQIAVGDLDGDGRPDIVVREDVTEGSTTIGRLAVLRATQDESFAAGKPLLGPPGVTFGAGTLDLADWDGDGTLDLAAASAVGMLLYPGPGDGTLQAARTQLSGLNPRTVLTVDANGDGFADLVSGGANGVVVSLGDGTGVYDEPLSRPIGAGATAVAMTDFNGDGRLDLVGSTNAGLRVSLQAADGTYAPPVIHGTTLVGEVATADLNGDGAPDIVATATDNFVATLLNNGAGAFVAGPRFSPGTGPTSLLLRDLDGDGKTDLAVTVVGTFDTSTTPRRFINAGVAVARGNGDGSFGPATIYATESTFGGWLRKKVAAGDVDNDGDLDLVVVAGAFANPVLQTADTRGMFVLLGQGNGTFQAGPTYLTTLSAGQIPASVALADFNRDGNLDAAVSTQVAFNRHDDVLLLSGNGDGTFGPPVALEGAGSAGEILAGDLNGDGSADLIVGEQSGFSVRSGLNVLLGQGDGTFGARMTYQAGDAFSVALGDANGDGALDVAAAVVEGGLLSVIFGRGDGTLRAPILTRTHETDPLVQSGHTFARSGQVFALAPADVNGDGRMDLAATYAYIPNVVVDIGGGDFRAEGGDEVGILIGNGDGTFQVRPRAMIPNYGMQVTGPNAWDIAVGDANGDGQLEFVAGLRAPKRIVTIPLQADGTLGTVKDHTGLAGGRISGGRYVIGDFDSDGRTDVAELARFGLPDQATVTVFRGQSNLTFTAGPTYPVGSKLPVITTERVLDAIGGDFNRDGHLDVAISEGINQNLTESGGLTVLLGNGDGSFRAPVVYAQGMFLGPLAKGDLDGDQDLDLVAAQGRTPRGVVLLSNSGSGSFTASRIYDSNAPALTLMDIATGDLAEDGVFDIAIANFEERSIRIIDVVPTQGAVVTNGILSVTGATINPVAGVGFTAAVATLTDTNPLATAGEYTATIDWGDGITSPGTVSADGRGGFTITGTHTYATTGLKTIAVRASDDEGATAAGTGVADVSASPAAIAAAPVTFAATEDVLFEGMVATFTSADPNASPADFTALISWGDGQTSGGEIMANGAGAFRVAGRHTYADPGAVSVPVSIVAISGASANTVSTGQVGPHTNVAPVAAGDSYVALEDVPLTVSAGQGVLANDADSDGDALTAVVVSGPSHGALALNTDGSFTFTPASEFSGTDSFTYRATDASLTSEPVLVTLTIRPVNDPPLAAADSTTTAEDTPIIIDVLANDGDVDGALDPTAVVFTGQPSHGTVRADAVTGAIVYAPARNFFSPDSVRYRVADEHGALSNEAVVSVAVLARNDAPVAVTDSYVASEDTPLVVAAGQGLLANDSDVDGDALTAVLVVGPAHGAVTLDPSGSFTYVPVGEFSGTDSFRYLASDGTGVSGAVTAWLLVQPVGDPPTIGPIADQMIGEGGFIAVPGSFSDRDPDDAWTATVDFGDGTGIEPLDLVGTSFALNHTYVESGQYTATASVADQEGKIGTASFSVTVQNLPPVVEAGSDRTAAEGARVHVAATFADPGAADTHTATIDWGDGAGAQPLPVDEVHGAGTLLASRAYADEGVYAVTITVTDDEGAAATDAFTVTVTNLAPFVDGGPDRTVDEGELVSLPALVPVLLSDPSLGLAPLNQLSGSYVDLGALDSHTATVNWGDGTEELAPVAGQPFGPPGAPAGISGVAQSGHRYGDDGTYSVQLTILDGDGGAGSDSSAVSVLNVAPSVAAGPDQEVSLGSVVSLAATFSDPGVLDTHTATIDWGDGVIEAGVLQGSLAAGVRSGTVRGSHVYASTGSFTVSVAVTDDDGGAGLDALLVRVAGAPGSVAPTANDDPLTTDEDAAATIDILANDTDADGTIDPTTVAITSQPGHGSVLVNPLTGAVTYTPEADFAGLDEFRYTVKDDEGLTSSAALVSVVVNPINDPPELMDIGDRTLVEGQTLNVTGSFADADPGDGWTATVDWGDGGGAEPLALMGTTFQLSHRYADDGTYTLTVTVTDSGGGAGSATALIDVANAAPVLADLAATSEVDEGGLVLLTGSVGDPGGDPLTLAVDWGDGAAETIALPVGAESFARSHRYLDDAPSGTLADVHAIQVRLLDDDGSEVEGLAGTVVRNVAPAAALGAPTAGVAGVPVSFTGTFTDPGVLDAHKVAWDFGDGMALVERPAADPGALTPTHTYAGEGVFTATLIVRDDDGGVATVESLISIAARELNTAPVAQLAGPAGGVRGQRLSFASMFTDPDLLDTHEVAVDWGDGTGIAFHPSTDPGALGPTHVYTEAKSYTVTWTVRDGAGAVGSASLPVTIQAVALQPDPVDPAKTALVVGGTNGNDEIKFIADKASGGLKLQINRLTLGPFAPTGRLVAYGLAGDDDIIVAAGIALPAELYGGPGQDTLKAGKGSAILVGGPGIDQLVAGTGRDLLIGGEGVDRLGGAGDGDILIGGATAYDDDPAALRAVMAEWTRTDLTYAERVDHLQNGGGRNGLVLLDAAAVSDDGRRDQVTGGRGLDWFFAGAGDRVTGRKAPEILAQEGLSRTFAIAWSLPAVDRATAEVANRRVAAPGMPEFVIEGEDDAIGGLGEKALLGEAALEAGL